MIKFVNHKGSGYRDEDVFVFFFNNKLKFRIDEKEVRI